MDNYTPNPFITQPIYDPTRPFATPICVPCNFGIHTSCATCLPTVKVTRHKHPLQLTHSLEIHQSNSRICLLYVKKVDTHWFYCCSICDFIAHLYCSMNPRNREYIKLEELVEEQFHLSVDSATYEVKNSLRGRMEPR